MVKERNSNYELMRIISMLAIIMWHIIIHSGLLNNCQSVHFKTILYLILMIIIIHVNSFVMVTGYFQSTSKFRQSKIWSLINSSLFYKALIVVIFSVFFGLKLTKAEFIREFFILNIDEYWFVKYYIFLYLISPFLNILIQKMSKKQYKCLLITSFLIFSVLPFITANGAFSNDGYNLMNFIFLYFIGGYLIRYPLKECYIFKNIPKKLFRIILLVSFIFVVLFNFTLFETNGILKDYGQTFNMIFGGMYNMALSYSNPLVIIQTIIYFSFFGTFDFKNKFINRISKLTIGIYLIHDNNFVRSKIYTFFKISIKCSGSYKFIIYMFIVAIIIFTVSAFIEFIRQKIFKFIYNLKISQHFIKKYYNFIDSCKSN